MQHFTREQCRALDGEAITRGIPSLLLMEHAALGATRVAVDLLGSTDGKHVWILCGPGNNGGDGYAMARLLDNAGVHVTVWDLIAPEKIAADGDPGINRGALAALGIAPVAAWESLPEAPPTDLVVDAIFGTGLTRAPEGRFADTIDRMHETGAPILAVDIPSGLDADTGLALGTTVRAQRTATFGVPKVGFQIASAREYTGDVYCVPIGVPRDLLPDGVPAAGDPVPVENRR